MFNFLGELREIRADDLMEQKILYLRDETCSCKGGDFFSERFVSRCVFVLHQTNAVRDWRLDSCGCSQLFVLDLVNDRIEDAAFRSSLVMRLYTVFEAVVIACVWILMRFTHGLGCIMCFRSSARIQLIELQFLCDFPRQVSPDSYVVPRFRY